MAKMEVDLTFVPLMKQEVPKNFEWKLLTMSVQVQKVIKLKPYQQKRNQFVVTLVCYLCLKSR